jgi:hypothetical protein
VDSVQCCCAGDCVSSIALPEGHPAKPGFYFETCILNFSIAGCPTGCSREEPYRAKSRACARSRVCFWFGNDARLTRGCWLSPLREQETPRASTKVHAAQREMARWKVWKGSISRCPAWHCHPRRFYVCLYQCPSESFAGNSEYLQRGIFGTVPVEFYESLRNFRRDFISELSVGLSVGTSKVRGYGTSASS